MEITKERAEQIINKRSLVEQAGVPYKKVEVLYVGYTDADGDAFVNDETGEEFAIVSFNAVTPYQLEKAVEDFVAEDYDSATNHKVSMRMPIKQANLVSKGCPGTLILREAEVEVDGEKVIGLFAKSFTPAQAVDSKKVSLADLLAKASAPAVTA
jgi:hypothetical protein